MRIEVKPDGHIVGFGSAYDMYRTEEYKDDYDYTDAGMSEIYKEFVLRT